MIQKWTSSSLIEFDWGLKISKMRYWKNSRLPNFTKLGFKWRKLNLKQKNAFESRNYLVCIFCNLSWKKMKTHKWLSFLKIKMYLRKLVCLLMTIPYWIMDARNFDTIHDLLRCLSLVQMILNGRNAQIWRIENRGVKCSPWIVFQNYFTNPPNSLFFVCRSLTTPRIYFQVLSMF